MKRCGAVLQASFTILGRLVWANLFGIMAVFFAFGALLSEQGLELLRLAHKPGAFAARLLALYAPLSFGAVCVALSSFLTGTVYAPQIRRAQRLYRLPAKLVAVVSFLIVPLAL